VDLREVRCENVKLDWLAQDKVQWAGFCQHGDEPLDSLNYEKFLTSCITINFHIICGLFNDTVSSSDYIVSSDELKRIWKEVAVA
jgi:hypothetical protein